MMTTMMMDKTRGSARRIWMYYLPDWGTSNIELLIMFLLSSFHDELPSKRPIVAFLRETEA